LLTIALRHKVFRGHIKRLGEGGRNRLGAPIRQAQIVFLRTDGIGVPLNQKHLVGLPIKHTFNDDASLSSLGI